MQTFLAAVTVLGFLIDVALLILFIWWMTRILRAAESAARSLGAAQHHLDQMRASAATVAVAAKQLAS